MNQKPGAAYLVVQYVTAARVPLAAGAGLLLYLARPFSWLAAVVVVLLGVCELTDIFDGLLARRLGTSSRFGELFDPYCDSMSRLIIFFGLASKGLCPLWLFLLLALRDVSVGYLRLMYILSGRRAGARLSGKIKAWAQGLGAILLAALYAFADIRYAAAGAQGFAYWSPLAVVTLVALVTLWSLLDYADAARRPWRAEGGGHA